MTPALVLGMALLAALQIADAATTVAALRLPGTRERNPLIRRLMRRLGIVPALVVVKGALAALFLWALLSPALLAPRDMLVATALACLLYLGIVANNLAVIRRRRRAGAGSGDRTRITSLEG